MIKKALLALTLFSSFIMFSSFTGSIINQIFNHGAGGY
jgi:hypothetical protein